MKKINLVLFLLVLIPLNVFAVGISEAGIEANQNVYANQEAKPQDQSKQQKDSELDKAIAQARALEGAIVAKKQTTGSNTKQASIIPDLGLGTPVVNTSAIKEKKKRADKELKDNMSVMAKREQIFKDALKRGETYIPLPVPKFNESSPGFSIEYDSPLIRTIALKSHDIPTVKICNLATTDILIDDSAKDIEFRRGAADVPQMVKVEETGNRRGVQITFTQDLGAGRETEPIPVKVYKENSNKIYVIQVQGVSCDDAPSLRFPRVIYLTEQNDEINPRLKGDKRDRILSPENKIIEVTKGLPDQELHKMRVEDVVFEPGSSWSIVSLELEWGGPTEFSPADLPEFTALESRQIHKIDIDVEYLPLQSKVVSSRPENLSKKKTVLRFNVLANINKSYATNNRYLVLFLLDKKNNGKQRLLIDLWPMIESYKVRGGVM